MAQLQPNWVPIDQMPEAWKDGRKLFFWTDASTWYREKWQWAGFTVPHDEIATHVSADTIAGPGGQPQR